MYYHMQRSLPPNISIPHIGDHLGDGVKDDAMQYVICDLQYIVYIYMLCRYIIYNTAEVYPMFIYFVYVNCTSYTCVFASFSANAANGVTIRRQSWSCHRRPGAADNSSCRPKLKLSGFQDLPELFSKVYSPVSTCIIHIYIAYMYAYIYIYILHTYIYIYILLIIIIERERGKSGSSSGIRQPSNTPVVQNTHEAWDRAQQARPGVLSSSTLAEAGKVLKSSGPIRSTWQKMPC